MSTIIEDLPNEHINIATTWTNRQFSLDTDRMRSGPAMGWEIEVEFIEDVLLRVERNKQENIKELTKQRTRTI